MADLVPTENQAQVTEVTEKPKRARAPRKKAEAPVVEDAPAAVEPCTSPDCIAHSKCEICGRKAKGAKAVKPGTPKQLASREAFRVKVEQAKAIRAHDPHMTFQEAIKKAYGK
jgi:hypothetical protein